MHKAILHTSLLTWVILHQLSHTSAFKFNTSKIGNWREFKGKKKFLGKNHVITASVAGSKEKIYVLE